MRVKLFVTDKQFIVLTLSPLRTTVVFVVLLADQITVIGSEINV